jgi:hypothetical protein
VAEADRGEVEADELVALLEDRLEEIRCAGIAARAELRRGARLHLGVAGAGREDRAAEGARAALQHHPRGREVVGKAVVQQLAGAEPRGEQRAGEAPVVGGVGLRLVDRAGRGEDARQPRHGRGDHAAEGWCLRLARDEVRLAREREARQRRGAIDRGRIDGGQQRGVVRRVRLRVRDQTRQRQAQRRPARVGTAGLQRVVVPVMDHSQRFRRL